MTRRTTTVTDIITALENAAWDYGLQQVRRGNDWELLTHADGDALAAWYKSAKLEKDMAELARSNPSRHAAMLEGQRALERIEAFRLEERRKAGANPAQYRKILKRHKDESKDAYKQAGVYVAFRRGAVYGFLPPGFKGSADPLGESTDGRMAEYGLLRNRETGEYLSVAKRHCVDERSGKYPVDCQRIFVPAHESPARAEKRALGVARWEHWVPHMQRRLRYMPYTQEHQIEAMEDSTRLRAHFREKAAAPARPTRALFGFFPAFRHAYKGEEGFFRALNDVFGPKGNAVSCGEGGKHDVHAGHFVDLYRDMSDKDRADFRAALYRFIDTLPALAKAAPDYALPISEKIAYIKTAVDHGPGALKASNGVRIYAENCLILGKMARESHARPESGLQPQHPRRKPSTPRW